MKDTSYTAKLSIQRIVKELKRTRERAAGIGWDFARDEIDAALAMLDAENTWLSEPGTAAYILGALAFEMVDPPPDADPNVVDRVVMDCTALWTELHELDEREEASPSEKLDTLNGLLTDAADLYGLEPPERQWLIEGWIQRGQVTALYGAGGTGKSLLAQMLQIAGTTGRPWLGFKTERFHSIGFYAEEDAAEIHRRCADITKSMGVTLADMGRDKKALMAGLVGVETVIFDENGPVSSDAPKDKGRRKNTLESQANRASGPTFYDRMVATIQEQNPDLVIVDNIARFYVANENDRGAVPRFINMLEKIAMRTGAAVLLLGHPGKAQGSEYSGSTAWDGAVRSRLYFGRPEADLDTPEHLIRDHRILMKAKANYSSIGDTVAMTWKEGAFVVDMPEAPASDMVSRIRAKNQDRADEDAFLKCLDVLRDQGRAVSDSPHAAKTYGPRCMTKMDAANGATVKRLEKAMERLFSDGRIKANREIGKKANRTPLVGIARTEWLPGDAPPSPEATAPDCTAPPDKSLKSLHPTDAPHPAPERTAPPANPLESLHRTCTPQSPLYTTYINGAAHGAAAPSNDTDSGGGDPLDGEADQ